MKKFFTLSSLFLLGTAGLLAAPLTPEEALQRLDSRQFSPVTRSLSKPSLKKTLRSVKGEADLYLFDMGGEGGFMVVSADDAVPALLGYSDSGSFDADNLAPGLEYWLQEYQRQIEYARANSSAPYGSFTRASVSPRDPIAPLIKTNWNQDAPYNNLCPKINNKSTYTGCVATAMSQVMNFFQYPAKGQGSITYDVNYGTTNNPNVTTYTMDFSTVTFDWDNMLATYSAGSYNTAQADAVATLMKAAGYSVQMAYSTSSSGAIGSYIPGAVVEYFGYDNAVRYVTRDLKTYSEWVDLIYDNLKNVGPVIYDGLTPSRAGHSFVCDGYSQDGYFHINWGWGGASNGYFLLDALDPSSIGIGGAYGGFDYGQGIVLGMQKPKAGSTPSAEEIVLMGTLKGATNSFYNTMYFSASGSDTPGLRYEGLSDMTFDIGCLIEDTTDPSAAPASYTCLNNEAYKSLMPLDAGYIIPLSSPPMFMLASLNLKDNVKYKVTLAYLPEGTSQWLPVEVGVGSFNYFYLTKDGENYQYENENQLQFDCTEMTLESTLYQGVAAKINVSVVNNNDTQLTRGAAVVLLNPAGNVVYMGESKLLSLDPGESYSAQWVTSFQATGSTTPSKVYLGLYDVDTATVYYKSSQLLTMESNPGYPVYNISFKLDGSTYENGAYYIENAAKFGTTTTVSVSSGIFSYPINIDVMDIKSMSMGKIEFTVLSTFTPPLSIIEAGQTVDIPVEIDFPQAVVGKDYYISLTVNNSTTLDVPVMKFIARNNFSGIESIGMENGELTFLYNRGQKVLDIMGGEDGMASVEAYYLNGMKAPVEVNYWGDNVSVNLSGAGKGVIIVTVTDKSGKRKSTKIAL